MQMHWKSKEQERESARNFAPERQVEEIVGWLPEESD
jgi:hypothetical protein